MFSVSELAVQIAAAVGSVTGGVATVTETAHREPVVSVGQPPTLEMSSTHSGDRVIVGELQNIDPPTRLDVLLWPGTLDGVPMSARCDHMGGSIRVTSNGTECQGVDY